MIKKFRATTTRDALRQVRDALGADAIILSNREVLGGVEIIAVADLDVAALAEQADPVPPPRPAQRSVPAPAPAVDFDQPTLTSFTEYLAQRESSVIRPAPARQAPPPPAREAAPARPGTGTPPARSPAERPQAARPQPGRPVAPPPETAAPVYEPAPAYAAALPPEPPPAREPAPEFSPVVQELAREVRMLRALVEGQLAGLAWGDISRREPQRGEVMKRLLAAGFSPALTKQLLERMPGEENLERSMKWMRAAIAHNLRVSRPEQDIIDQGGIYALVGPTGVGKTTTVAKLAARAVLKHGKSRVAMITTDSYRIGAKDQLRIYGSILGTPVFAVRDENDLELTLLDLRGKHLVFIDTMGMNQRDKRVAEQINMLSGEGQSIRRLLLLGAPSQGITLEEVVRAYSGPGLAGCILTKIDEALTYGPALDVVIRHQLTVHYVTNGQRVPEDLHLANALYLVDRAFRLGEPDPAFTAEEEDYPVLMAAAETGPGAGDEASFLSREAFGATG